MNPIAWPEAQRICDIPEVREALDAFAADAHEEHMLAMVSAIMGHAAAQGRAAGLEEAAKRVRDFLEARETMIGLDEKEVYAVRSRQGYFPLTVDDLRALSSISADAGKDDALELDAQRYQFLRTLPGMSVEHLKIAQKAMGIFERDDDRIPTPEEFDACIDAAIAAIAAQGKE